MSSQFEVLSNTHKIEVADYDEEQKWVFNKNYDYDGEEVSVGTIYKLVYSTKETAITANSNEDVTLQDVPDEVFDFLDEQGYHTDFARESYQL